MRVVQLTMTVAEKKPRSVQVLDLQSGEMVAIADISHIPPAGGTTVTMTPTVATPYVNFVLGPFPDLGTHLIDVQATGDAGTPSKPVVRYIVEVK